MIVAFRVSARSRALSCFKFNESGRYAASSIETTAPSPLQSEDEDFSP